MAGFRGQAVLAGLLLLGAASSAQGWWDWRWWGYGYAYYSPTYYVPLYYYSPVYPVCATAIPVAAPQSRPPAKKVAEGIPGGTTKEPPVLGDMLKKGPVITESRSTAGGLALPGSTKGRCKVGFWNMTGRDVTLKVGGDQRLLPKDRALTLDLDRSFAWQIDQGETVTERVPDEQSFHEVILRQ